MDETTQPVASAPVAPPGTTDRGPNKKLIIGGIVLVAAVVLIALVPMIMKNLQVSNALGGARILVSGAEKSGLYEYTWLGMRQVKLPVEGTVTDYARNGAHEAVIAHEGDANKSLAYVLGDEPRTVGVPLGEKASIAISPDGAWVAYATRADVGGDLYSWNVQAVEVATGDLVELGAGFAPQFFTRDGMTRLMFRGPEGITIADLSARKSFTTPFTMPAEITNAGAVAADGSRFVSRNNYTGEFTLYTVSAVEPYFMPVIAGTIPGRLSGVRFTHDALIATEGAELKRVEFDAPGTVESVHTFKDATATYRLIP